MIKYILICLLAISHGINGRPSQQLPGDLASHILIVTPQAQVHLEPALKYDALAPATFIQHLSPLARIAAPHEETIIYVPSGAAVDHAAVSLARSTASFAEPLRKHETKQYEQITQQIEQAQAAIQQGSSAIGPQLSEAASAAASAASSAGSGFFPTLFPPAAPAPAPAPAASSQKIDKYEYEALPASPLLVSPVAEGRRFYALTPAVSHVIDFVHTPVFVGPLSAVRARSILPIDEAKEKIIEAAPLPAIESFKPELPAIEMLLEKKEPELSADIPKIQADRLMIDAATIKEEEEKKLEEKLPFEKVSLDKQLKKEEPVMKEFFEKEKEKFQAQPELQADLAKEYKAPEFKLPQERKEELKEFKEPEIKQEEIKPFQTEEQKPFEQKEKFLEKAESKDTKEFKDTREEFKKEEKPAEEPQAQAQFLKEGFQPESIKAAEGQHFNKISAIIPEKKEEPQAQSLRASSGRIEASEVVPAHAHVHNEEVAQQPKSVIVPVEQPVVPVFVPQSEAI